MADHPIPAPASFANEADKQLFGALRQRLLDYEPLRATRPQISLEVHHDTVRLSGRVRTLAMKEIAGYLCQRHDAVTTVRNDLVSDPEVVRQVADQLAADPVLGPQCIRVDARFGFVTLSGDIDELEHEALAVQVAAAAPSVAGVASDLTVRRRDRPPTAPAREPQADASAKTPEVAGV